LVDLQRSDAVKGGCSLVEWTSESPHCRAGIRGVT